MCSCGWTRFRLSNGNFVELAQHITEQGEYGSLMVPVTVHGAWGPRNLPAAACIPTATRR